VADASRWFVFVGTFAGLDHLVCYFNIVFQPLSKKRNVFGSRDLSPYKGVTLPPMKKVKVNASHIPLEDEFVMQNLLYIVVYFHKCDA